MFGSPELQLFFGISLSQPHSADFSLFFFLYVTRKVVLLASSFCVFLSLFTFLLYLSSPIHGWEDSLLESLLRYFDHLANEAHESNLA